METRKGEEMNIASEPTVCPFCDGAENDAYYNTDGCGWWFECPRCCTMIGFLDIFEIHLSDGGYTAYKRGVFNTLKDVKKHMNAIKERME